MFVIIELCLFCVKLLTVFHDVVIIVIMAVDLVFILTVGMVDAEHGAVLPRAASSLDIV